MFIHVIKVCTRKCQTKYISYMTVSLFFLFFSSVFKVGFATPRIPTPGLDPHMHINLKYHRTINS